MDQTIVMAALTAAAALVGGGATYLVARRANSGKIDTSDAAQLWLEGQNMRRDLRDEVVLLRGKVQTLEHTGSEQRDLIVVLRSKVGDMEAKAQIMAEKIIRLELVSRQEGPL